MAMSAMELVFRREPEAARGAQVHLLGHLDGLKGGRRAGDELGDRDAAGLVDIKRQLLDLGGDIGQPRFRVAHCRRLIAVNRAEVSLPINERKSQRKLLRQCGRQRGRNRPHQRRQEVGEGKGQKNDDRCPPGQHCSISRAIP